MRKEDKYLMKKYQVLIIDDEIRIALLIKKLIHWNEIGLECMDVVDNGEIALKKSGKESIPILLLQILGCLKLMAWNLFL